MHFLLRAKTLVAFPGGFGTLDELSETRTLVQTGKVKRVSILLFGRECLRKIIDFEALVEEGTIAPEVRTFFEYVDDARVARQAIKEFYAAWHFACPGRLERDAYLRSCPPAVLTTGPEELRLPDGSPPGGLVARPRPRLGAGSPERAGIRCTK